MHIASPPHPSHRTPLCPSSPKALVLLLNPLYDKMKPCPFFLNGKCRFEVDDCSYSHGHLVAQSDILPYREPDHASLGVGAICLAQDEDSGLWKRAQVTSVDATGVGVTFDEQRREAVLEYSSVLPLGGWGRGGAVLKQGWGVIFNIDGLGLELGLAFFIVWVGWVTFVVAVFISD